MNPGSLGPVVGIIIAILCILYAIIALLVPVFIYSTSVSAKRLLEEQRRANKMFEACLKRLLEEQIKANRALSALTSA